MVFVFSATPLSRSGAIVADILVIAVTWKYALQNGTVRRGACGIMPSKITDVLLYNANAS
ncbi:hypothetical protein BC628DRAFT_912167 [Trametes gibbosa]|nr:hypothetical protein BC628DRAFT_912167 [Trametes gibbosa]